MRDKQLFKVGNRYNWVNMNLSNKFFLRRFHVTSLVPGVEDTKVNDSLPVGVGVEGWVQTWREGRFQDGQSQQAKLLRNHRTGRIA